MALVGGRGANGAWMGLVVWARSLRALGRRYSVHWRSWLLRPPPGCEPGEAPARIQLCVGLYALMTLGMELPLRMGRS